MQCWNCQFENIPGLPACARCGSTLSLSGVDVVPPRASRLRALTWLARARYRLARSLPSLGALLAHLRRLAPEPVCWRALAWSFIPGLGHLKTNRRRLGRPLLAIWLVLLLATLLSVGTSWCWLAFTAMTVTHAVALLSLLAANLAYERLYMRLLFGTLVLLCLQFFVYRPVQWFMSRFYYPVVVPRIADQGIVATGDGLLVEGPWLRPERYARGDVVVCQITPTVMGHRGWYVVRAGQSIDRVVGVPGDHIQISDGRLLVNGAPPPKGMAPLGPVPEQKLDVRLGAGEYVVLPSLRPEGWTGRAANLPQLPERVFQHLSVFPQDRIVGRVVLRLRPFLRCGRIE